jgi:serine/threonine protein kinase
MGTPQYLSPEQAQGGTATPASDVYSLGVVAFECLAGRRPFVAETAVATALAHLRDPVPDLPPHVPADLAAVVRRAMSKSPEDRFPDATAFAAALRNPSSVRPPAAAAAAPTEATQVLPATAATAVAGAAGPPTEPTDGRRRAVPWGWILLALAIIAGIILVAMLASGGEDDPETPGPTESSRTTQASKPTSSATEEEGITIDESDYIGRDVNEVSAELKALGLKVAREKLDNPGDEEENTVEGVSPSGTLQEGDTVTVSYWGKAAPEPPPTTESSETQPPETTETTETTAATESSSPAAGESASAAATEDDS